MHFLMVLCFAAVASARPQGYDYQAPAASNQVGVAAGLGSGHFASGSVGGGLGGSSGFAVGGAGSGLGGHSGGGFAAGGALGAGSGLGGGTGLGAGGGLGAGSGLGGGSGLGAGSGFGQAGGSITKNFFIHSAPEDSDEDILNDSQNAGPSDKKYNVVFVKAPSPSAKAAALALRKAQSEEKTLIYVLNKNIDASDLQAALAGTPTEPTKPEVVFIKYKTPEEAQHAQHQIQQQYEALGGGPSFVSDEGVAPVSSVIGSLGSAHHPAQAVSNQYLPQHH